jgi:uncharacterized Zn finger protein (UPF0148 family)
MSKCPVCSSILAELLTSTYCPTCEAKEAQLPTDKVPAPAFARQGLWQIVTDELQEQMALVKADPDFTISILYR